MSTLIFILVFLVPGTASFIYEQYPTEGQCMKRGYDLEEDYEETVPGSNFACVERNGN